jgi:hypothetical protein
MDFEKVLNEAEQGPVVYPLPEEGIMVPGLTSPAPAPKLMMEQVFEALSRHVGRISQDAKALEITDPDRMDYAIGLVGESKKMIKQFQAKQKEVTQGASDFIDSVRGFVGRYTGRLSEAEQIIKVKISNYRLKEEIERKKQEALAQKAAADLQKKLNKEAAKAGVEAPLVPEIPIPKEKTAIKSESGTTAYDVKRWTCNVLDPDAVPRQYCEPVKKLLDEAVKMGVREIPCCEIKEITETRFRS